MKVQVMTISTSTESSQSELSSGGQRPFKVFVFFNLFWPQAVVKNELKKTCERCFHGAVCHLLFSIEFPKGGNGDPSYFSTANPLNFERTFPIAG